MPRRIRLNEAQRKCLEQCLCDDLPAAEVVASMCAIGIRISQRSVERRAAAWRRERRREQVIRSINVEVFQFLQPGAADAVLRLKAKLDLSPGWFKRSRHRLLFLLQRFIRRPDIGLLTVVHLLSTSYFDLKAMEREAPQRRRAV